MKLTTDKKFEISTKIALAISLTIIWSMIPSVQMVITYQAWSTLSVDGIFHEDIMFKTRKVFFGILSVIGNSTGFLMVKHGYYSGFAITLLMIVAGFLLFYQDKNESISDKEFLLGAKKVMQWIKTHLINR